jgi:Tol biopolymer transport system component
VFFTARIGKNMARLFYSKWSKDGWTFPEIPAFSRGHIDYLPYIMPNGQRMFFGRIAKDENGKVISRGLYATDKVKSDQFSWSEPNLFVDGENWMHISATSDLTIYTTYLFDHKIARFRLINGKYKQKEATTGGLYPGAHPSIAPDESYIIFDSEREGGMGKSDLWVSFREKDGTWGQAINLGDKVNTTGNESIPHLTADGRYLFYTSKRDIYWVDTKLLIAFRSQVHPADGD